MSVARRFWLALCSPAARDSNRYLSVDQGRSFQVHAQEAAGKAAKQAGIMGAIFGLGTDIGTIGQAGGTIR